jgi:hypothetical protein
MPDKKCKICGTLVTRFIKSKQQYWDWCSNRCMGRDPEILKRKQQTSLEKYGYSHAMHDPRVLDRMKQQFIENWGVDNPSKSQIVKDRIRAKFQEVYGVDNVSLDPAVIDRIRKSAVERYQNRKASILCKRRQTLMESRGVSSNKHLHMSPESISKYNDLEWLRHQHFDLQKTCHQIATELGVSDTVILHRLKLAEIQPTRWSWSESEKQLRAFIETHYSGKILINDRKLIYPRELDIVIPDLRLAVEFNGVFWHSEQRGKTRHYHVSKTRQCEEQGYQLIHIYDTEWSDPRTRPIIESRLLHLLGRSTRIAARKCQIVCLDKKQASDFVNQNHLQSWCGCKCAYGLVFGDQLVAVITLGQSRFNHKIQWELLRYCALKNHTVVGGMTKLLSKITADLNINELISYADRRWSSAIKNIYSSAGFQLQGVSEPNYKYFQINDSKIILESRNKYQKHRLNELLKKFDPNLSEFENMCINDYFRIWDCGNLVYVWRRNA